MQSPERAEAAPATRKERTTAGPAVFLATPPARTYTPTPRVEPIPRRVRSVVLRHLLSPPWPSPPAVASSLFLRVNRDFNPSNIFAPVDLVFLLPPLSHPTSITSLKKCYQA